MAATILQLMAMWSIVIVAVTWFVRDEKHRYDTMLSARALRFATVPHYRRPAADETASRRF